MPLFLSGNTHIPLMVLKDHDLARIRHYYYQNACWHPDNHIQTFQQITTIEKKQLRNTNQIWVKRGGIFIV